MIKSKGIFKSVVAVTVATIITVVSTPVPLQVYGETTYEKLKKAEQEQKEAYEGKTRVSEKKEYLQEAKEELKDKLDKLNDDLSEISQVLEELEDEIETKQEEVDRTSLELEKAKEEEEKQYDFMKLRIKYLYENKEESIVASFLSSKSYASFLNKAEYSKLTEKYDKKVFSDLIQLREDIEDKEALLEVELSELQDLLDKQEKEQKKVTVKVSATSGEIAAHEGAISVATLEEAAYEQELKEKELELKELREQLRKEQAMTRKASTMAWRDVSQIEFDESDRNLLACLIYCEAGNQPYEGQVAVGAVVINRMRSAAFPDTMVGVIYQNKQFSPVGSGRLAARLVKGPNSSCLKAADAAMGGSSPVGNCLYFRTIIPEINGQIIGDHVFY